MDLSTVHALYRTFAGDRATLLYSGRFHDEHTARLIALGEEFLEREGADKPIRGKLAFIMVEAYQNIIRHRAPLPIELQEGAGRSVFLLRSTSAQHEVASINPVTEQDATGLRASLAHLEALDPHAMKQLFLNSLQREDRTERGGAGLGLIEIARRSGHELRHEFRPLDATHELFTLQAMVGRNAVWRGPVSKVFDVHEAVVEHGVSILCRGHLSTGEQEVVLRMIERDLDTEGSRADARSRTYLAVTELLHGLGTVGEGPMVILGRSEGRVYIVVAAPISNEAKGRIMRAVEEVNALDRAGLQRRYRDILLARGEAGDTVQLGLIELARKSIVPLRLELDEEQGTPFMALQAEV